MGVFIGYMFPCFADFSHDQRKSKFKFCKYSFIWYVDNCVNLIHKFRIKKHFYLELLKATFKPLNYPLGVFLRNWSWISQMRIFCYTMVVSRSYTQWNIKGYGVYVHETIITTKHGKTKKWNVFIVILHLQITMRQSTICIYSV